MLSELSIPRGGSMSLPAAFLRDAEQLGKGQYVPRRLPLDFCS